MKKVFITLSLLIVIVIAGLIVLSTVDFNRAGKENVFVQVIGKGEEETFTSSDGAVYKSYWYTLPAYNEQGEQIEVKFSATKELKLGAYLKLYVKEGNEVTSYDEVSHSELPIEVQKILQ